MNPQGDRLTGHQNSIGPVAFSPDGSLLVSGSDDRTLRLWDAATGEQVGRPFTGHQRAVRGGRVQPDGTRIVSGADDNTVRIWDVDSAEQIGGPLTGHTAVVLAVAFSPDGTRIASAVPTRRFGSGTARPVRPWVIRSAARSTG